MSTAALARLKTTSSTGLALLRRESVVYSILIALVGLGYRATFITQGFDATDEGWLQSVGRRITLGQVPYRDFGFFLPPVSIYKEAALQAVFGDAYTLLFSRWVFVAEATLGSVIAYLILRRFVSDRLAFLVTLPTLSFSVLAYYFSNYTYDGEVLVMVSVLFLTMAAPNRRWPAVVAGIAAGLAGLAKPSYFAFVVLVPVIGLVGDRLIRNRDEVHRALVGVYRSWPLFLAGAVLTFGAVLALFALAGAAGPFLEAQFPASAVQAVPRPFGFAIWQDLPTAFTSRELKLFGLVCVLLIVAALPGLRSLRWIPVLCVPLGLIAYSYRYFRLGVDFMPMVLGLLLVMNVLAVLISLAARAPGLRSAKHSAALRSLLPPPELLVIALALQYLAQFTFSGIIYSYLGAYLSVPVALLLLRALWRVSPASAGEARILTWASIAPALFAGWIVVASIDYVQNHVYFDAPRSQLTAAFNTPKLAGIWSAPANVRRVDGMVSMVDRYSKPGDPILVMPDFACLYFVTDRENPSGQDWMSYVNLSNSEAAAVHGLESRPPKVVFLQSVSEFDWARSGRADYVVDYSNPPLVTIYDYIRQNYVQVATVDDIAVLVPRGSG